MDIRFGKVIMLVSLVLAVLFCVLSTAEAYNAYSARAYAEFWILQYNRRPYEDQSLKVRNFPQYNKYSSDCANFASQCLLAGGLDLEVHNEWTDGTPNYWADHYDEKGCWISCVGLDDQLYWGHHDEINYSYDFYWSSNQGRSWMQIGDIMIFGDADAQTWREYFKHAAVVATGSGINVEMNAHTSERWHRPRSWFFPGTWDMVHYYHICSWAKPVLSEAVAPSEFFLDQNVPNPFNPSTVISFSLPIPTSVRLSIYDLLGQNIRTLLDGVQSEGGYSVLWDGKDSLGQDVASGIYLYRLEASDFVQTRKMLLLR